VKGRGARTLYPGKAGNRETPTNFERVKYQSSPNYFLTRGRFSAINHIRLIARIVSTDIFSEI
jgi:hypothetical protein